MKLKLYLLLVISVVFFSSCAQRYSTRGGDRAIIERQDQQQPKRTKKVRAVRIGRAKKVKNIRKAPSRIAKKRNTKTQTKKRVNSPTVAESEKRPSVEGVDEKIRVVIEEAYRYLGTRYKYAGSTKAGIDCSGLMCAAFKEVDINLNRSAHGISQQGEKVDIKDVKVGDILCFKTIYKNRIGHVGLVVEVGDEIRFIHSSTSKGVIISSLDESYWKKAYRSAVRVF